MKCAKGEVRSVADQALDFFQSPGGNRSRTAHHKRRYTVRKIPDSGGGPSFREAVQKCRRKCVTRADGVDHCHVVSGNFGVFAPKTHHASRWAPRDTNGLK